MSVIKPCLRLADGATQSTTTATAGALQRREVLIPVTEDGSAVRVLASGGIPSALSSIRAAAVLTGSYVGSTAVDLAGVSGVTLLATVTVTNAETISMKAQWSLDNSVWTDEEILSDVTISGTEAQYSFYSRVISIDATTALQYIERYNKLARYFRAAVKSTGTTAKLKLEVQTFQRP